jgi:hypothetical protein
MLMALVQLIRMICFEFLHKIYRRLGYKVTA